MNKEIKAIFIDWNGTLSTSRFFEQLEQSDPEAYRIIQSTLFSGELSHLINPWMVGEIDTETVIDQLSTTTGLEHEDLFSYFVESCKNMVIPESVLGLVDQIRARGINVVIATDNMDSFERWTTPSLGLENHFDAILNSYSLKARKKDFENNESRFFGAYLRDNNIPPENTILIDDSEDKDGQLSDYGIEYRKIEFGEGLIEQLSEILQQQDESAKKI